MKKCIFLTLTILFSLVSVWSLPYKITYLTADNGLSRNLVDYIFRDSRGFMWFCTTKGLDRYDGYEYVHFDSRSPVNPLISDNVHCVEEDTNGDLWIGTENGLYFLNYKTGEIVNSNKKLSTKAAFTSHQIIFINKDEQGNLWVGYNSGLAKIHVEKDVILGEEIYHTTTGISSILFYNGNILVSHDNEIFRLIKGNDGKYNRVNADNKLRSFPGSMIMV